MAEVEKTVKLVVNQDVWNTFVGLLKMRGISTRGYLSICVEEYVERELKKIIDGSRLSGSRPLVGER